MVMSRDIEVLRSPRLLAVGELFSSLHPSRSLMSFSSSAPDPHEVTVEFTNSRRETFKADRMVYAPKDYIFLVESGARVVPRHAVRSIRTGSALEGTHWADGMETVTYQQ
jgi:hypothetical protein